MQLTTGADREGSYYILDTSDGTVTRYCVVKYLYEPTYDKDDLGGWRDRMCASETVMLAEVLEEWRGHRSTGI